MTRSDRDRASGLGRLPSRDPSVVDMTSIDGSSAGSMELSDEVFGLEPLCSSIQDYDNNTTRFLVVGRVPLSPAAPDKTSIVFTLSNEPGALFKALAAMALRGIDLTKLESRPIPGRKWEYLFYVDLAAARDDLACARALAQLAEFAPMVRVLGSYPSSKPAAEASAVSSGRWVRVGGWSRIRRRPCSSTSSPFSISYVAGKSRPSRLASTPIAESSTQPTASDGTVVPLRSAIARSPSTSARFAESKGSWKMGDSRRQSSGGSRLTRS